jgi:NAD(P)-dependent dehydrogenase (short-subunit alcohol dehydrogenase family)
LVTGGGGGLGAAICQTIAAEGAAIVAADVRIERAEGVAEQARTAGGQALAIELDISDENQVAEAIRATIDRFGRFDILINNAGVDVTLPVDELTVEEWDRIIGVNLRGPFLLSRLAFRHMKERRSGHIVNIISTAAKRAWPNASAYHASKWGLLGFSHALHAEGRQFGIKVTAVVSGGMRTPFLLDRFPDIDTATLQDPLNVAQTVRFVLLQPEETVIPELMVLPMRETSWP